MASVYSFPRARNGSPLDSHSKLTDQSYTYSSKTLSLTDYNFDLTGPANE